MFQTTGREKRAGVTTLISGNIDFEVKTLKEVKKGPAAWPSG